MSSSRRRVVIIPARMASTRLPGKPLADICGRTMIEWVYRRAASARGVDAVMVATPDVEIAEAVLGFGGRAVMTSDEHRSGTDRVAEAAAELEDEDIVVNVQGDEPMITPEAVESLIPPLESSDAPDITSLMRAVTPDEAADPNLVKVVVDLGCRALYFSRSMIPYLRNDVPGLRIWGHVGIYAYTVRALRAFSRLEPTPLETAESLEQLRAVENGWDIRMVETSFKPIGVDTEADLERVRRLFASNSL
jgi:3-deoxy-manno-octulosonate cytidylyltransferase (CMP-KDO synthetase)